MIREVLHTHTLRCPSVVAVCALVAFFTQCYTCCCAVCFLYIVNSLRASTVTSVSIFAAPSPVVGI